MFSTRSIIGLALAACLLGSASAEEHGHSSGGHDSSHATGHDSGHGSDHGDRGKGPKFQGGRDTSPSGHGVEDKVFHGGNADDGEHGSRGEGSHRPNQGRDRGRPAWAQEGLPTNELGRLSLSRAPQHVLDRQLSEALASYNLSPEQMAAFYNQSLAEIVAVLDDRDTFLTATRLDSPAQNLALLQELLADGQTQLPGVHANSPGAVTKLAAVYLGTASDKAMTVTPQVAESVLIILGVKESALGLEVDIGTLASQAEAVRAAIAAGHGE